MKMSNEIKGTTILTGLLGYPVDHSKSPKMHNLAFGELGLDYAYMAFNIEEGKIGDAISSFKALNARGGNITMPHKMTVMEHLDEISEEAKLIGSVNTFKIEEGKVTGYNTDGHGFVKSLQERNVDFKGKKIVLVGGGGAAKAVAIQLALEGAKELVLFNRTLSSVEVIADNINKNIPDSSARALKINEKELAEEIKDACVLVNCTSLGMRESIDTSIISSSKILPKDLFVADIIYDPHETKFLKQAKEAGCEYMNGLMMMVWQGAVAFEIWTGTQMPVELIKEQIFVQAEA